MTLTTPYSATFIVGDGETKTFSYLFEEVSPNFISVMVYNSLTGLISTPTYVIDTDQKQVIFGEDTPAPTADETVCIYRNTPNVQDVAFRTLHGYDAQTLENILSKIVAMIQEIKSNYFSTQVLQGDPWQLDLLSSEDDGATVNIDYTAKKLVKGLYFRITSGNLQVSADGTTYITLPKSDDVAEFRQYEQTLPDLTVIRKLQYRVGNQWFDAEANAQYTADEAYALAESVQTTMNAHINNTQNPHQTSMANLTDTDLSDAESGQFLQFDGIKWKAVYSTASVSWGSILGDIDDQTDLKIALDGKVDKAGDTMTGVLNIADIASSNTPLLTLTHSNTTTYKWNIATRYNSTTLSIYPGSTETNGFRFATTGFVPASNNARYLGSASLKWKGVYTAMINNGYDIAVPVTTSADTFALVNKDIDPLQQQINHLQTIGRFLSFWDATTGLAQTNPQTSPYVYKTGDYFRVGVVATGGGTNYKPSGSSYTTGVASTVIETEPLTVGQVYYYDGTNWALAAGGNVAIDGTTIVFNSDNELQAVATVNQNTATGATNPVFNWVGTLAEYQAQNIETLHPDWLCYITDDVGGGASVYTKAQVDSLLALKVSTGHEVIEFQAPTAENNHTWYRKYADGWVEQGGTTESSGGSDAKNITFPVEMANTNYVVQVTIYAALPFGSPGNNPGVKNDNTTTGMKIYSGNTGSLFWEVKGMAA